MLFTKASEYALMAMIYLAKCDEAVDVECLSAKLNISKSFLAKILQFLAKAGLLRSFKGARGGFELAKSAEDISLAQIISAAEKHNVKVFDCSLGDCPSGQVSTCAIWPIINRLQTQVDDYLASISLEELINGSC